MILGIRPWLRSGRCSAAIVSATLVVLVAMAGAAASAQAFEATEGSQFSGRLVPEACFLSGTPTIEWGDGQTSEGIVEEHSAISGTHTYAEEGTFNGFVNYEDDCGSHRVAFQANVADAALRATGAPLNATAGTQFNAKVATFSDADPGGVASDYTATIEWGDGATSPGTVSAAGGGGFTVTGSHTYAAGGAYRTSATINDAGGASAFATSSANVLTPIKATEGSRFSRQLAKATCGIFGTPTIEWGDGQTSNATVTGVSISGTHTYAEEGTFNGSVSYEEGECGSHKVAFQATVADAALRATGAPLNATAGAQFNAKVATFSDADPGGTASDYTASIDWGDGTESTAGTVSAAAGGGFEIKNSHTYATAGQYTTTVTVNDIGGAKATATSSANVVGPPIVSNEKVISVTETTAKIGFTIDPNGADTTYTIEYGPTTSYGQKTAPVDIGATPGPQPLTQTLTGLEPGKTYHFNVVATNSAAPKGVGGGDQSFTTASSANVVGPPIVSNEKVISVTETTAKIGFTIDPNGADTTYTIEYGPTTSYGQKTAPVDVGATPGPQPLTLTITGLEPGSVYHFNVLATNAAGPGGVSSGDQPFTTAQPSPPVVPPGPSTNNPNLPAPGGPTAGSGVLGFKATLAALPPPVLGKTVNVTPVSGVVYVELPPGATLASAASVSPFSPFALGAQAVEALTKGRAFVPLTEARQIPVGSILETTHGVVGITTATTASPKGKLQSGDFGAGIFKLLQGRRQKGLTELDIINNLNARQVCTTLGKKARIASTHLSSKVLGQLNSSGHGHFTARGQDSAATVRGTVWSVKNQCDGTLTHVKRGVVTVRDFSRRKTITLFTGQSYLARGPIKRG